ncbi:MAG: LPS assembly lipoprotein LptE [candidate division KSB1 bacterium]|nr:LPS assembly lipoprotein LptE [candidate division KSB1 bacterium]
MKIGDRRNADAILEGVLMRVEDRPGAYNRQEQVQEIQVFLTVQIKYRDLKKRKIIWEDTISQFGTYTPGGSENSTREDAISEAIAKIADEVLNRTVSGW